MVMFECLFVLNPNLLQMVCSIAETETETDNSETETETESETDILEPGPSYSKPGLLKGQKRLHQHYQHQQFKQGQVG
jgi:hypothetical protein